MRHRLGRAVAARGRLPGRVRGFWEPQCRVPSLATSAAWPDGPDPRSRCRRARRFRRGVRVRRHRARRGPVRVLARAGTARSSRRGQLARGHRRRPTAAPSASGCRVVAPRFPPAAPLLPRFPRTLAPSSVRASACQRCWASAQPGAACPWAGGAATLAGRPTITPWGSPTHAATSCWRPSWLRAAASRNRGGRQPEPAGTNSRRGG